jgi:hypothetical protein
MKMGPGTVISGVGMTRRVQAISSVEEMNDFVSACMPGDTIYARCMIGGDWYTATIVL